MKLELKHGDILEAQADALIYSTNVQLLLSGGVGACLLRKYGLPFQQNLYRCLDATGSKLAEVGDVFVTNTEGLPWKKIFHTVATGPFYHTDEAAVGRILKRSLENCSEDPSIDSVVMSPLGAGYGDLAFPKFLEIANDVVISLRPSIEKVTICCDDVDFFEELSGCAKRMFPEWVSTADICLQPSSPCPADAA